MCGNIGILIDGFVCICGVCGLCCLLVCFVVVLFDGRDEVVCIILFVWMKVVCVCVWCCFDEVLVLFEWVMVGVVCGGNVVLMWFLNCVGIG